MKISLTIILILCFSVVATAQNKSKTLLDRSYAAFEKSEGIRLSFVSTMTDKDGVKYEPQTGEAYIKGNQFKLEMEAMDIWFDGKTQWVYMKEVNEVNISTPTASEIAAISPLALLGIYKNGFTLKAPASKTINGKSTHLIDMVPASQNKDFKSITAAIDKESGNIVQVIMVMNNGVKQMIDITDYNTNHQFGDAMFRFNINNYPRVEIVDLR